MFLKEEYKNFARKEFGVEFSEELFNAIENTSPSVSIRLNPNKIPFDCDIDSKEKVGWCDNGYYIKDRPIFTLDPLLHAGAYYVQEASSMFLEQIFKQHILSDNDSPRVLDLCASPGGKSTHILSMLNGKGFLLSNEVVKTRANILCENITKWGYENCAVSNSSADEIGKFYGMFDVILVDAPCSGEGMFRKDQRAIDEWSENNVKLCSKRQKEILLAIIPALKTGGVLIYSTCTYNKYEDEENTDFIEKEFNCKRLAISHNYIDKILENNCGYHFFPQKIQGEGFFISAFRKEGSEECEMTFEPSSKKKEKTQNKIPNEVRQWVNCIDFEFIDNCLVPSSEKKFIEKLKSEIKLLQYGVKVYEEKGKDLIPMHSLAMSKIINKNHFEVEEVDLQTALKYLKKESIILKSQTKGFILISYRGILLGFVKNLGNRANNVYPQNWRILMDISQTDFTKINTLF